MSGNPPKTRQRRGKGDSSQEDTEPPVVEQDVDADSSVADGPEPVQTSKLDELSIPQLNVKLSGLQAWLDSVPEWPWMPLLVFLIAALTRYWRLFNPPAVVFDESHFGRFTNQYNAGTYFYDIHPPLGKFFLITEDSLVAVY